MIYKFFLFFFTKCVAACETELGINVAFVLIDNISTKKYVKNKNKQTKLPSKHTWLLKKRYRKTHKSFHVLNIKKKKKKISI